MLFAATGQCCCMAILAGTVYDGSQACGIIAAVMLFVFNFFFAVGLLAIPWLCKSLGPAVQVHLQRLAANMRPVPAEYAPLAIRTRAAALATASNWIFTFLVVEITPVSIANVGYRTYVYFCIFNFLFIPLIYFFYPETQWLSLEQIDKLFTGEKVMLRWDPAMGVPGEAPETKDESVDETAGAEHSEQHVDAKTE